MTSSQSHPRPENERPEALKSNDSIHTTLKTVFGFPEFRDGQEMVINKILQGKSALALFPTGSGKSLCYQLSALHLAGVTLVVSPLIALMKDQIDFLLKRSIAAARLDSSVELVEKRKTENDLRQGRLRLLYVAPERFANERFLQKLRQLKIALLVIDEAHCISQWGHNFRPDYLKLARLAKQLGIEPVLALTATATPAVAADICREFKIEPDAFVHTGFYRPNLTLRVTECRNSDRVSTLLDRLKNRSRGPTIVYVTLQQTSETVAAALQQSGLAARAYHAGMTTELRTEVQEWFMNSADGIVVATIAFGMGIDKADIRFVYHYNLPGSIENLAQEIGRAGRDGKPATCEILAHAADVTVLENFSYGDTPEFASIDSLVDSLMQHQDEFDVSLYELSRDHDTRPLVVGTLLTYLELADVIETTAPFYNEYQFVLLSSLERIYSRFDERRAEFLRQLFAQSRKAQKWHTVDLAETVIRLATSRERIINALSYLEEQGDLELKTSGLRQGYRSKSRPQDFPGLKRELLDRFQKREEADVNRVGQVLTFTTQTGCLVRHLLKHFGEDLGRNCGHCGPCLGDKPTEVVSTSSSIPPYFDAPGLAQVRQKHSKALRSPRQVTRFLCGLNSPWLTQEKLNRNPLFGSLGGVSFRTVMSAVEREMSDPTTAR
jgi:ATP-dependent DNA helicase RecQ